MRRELHRLSLAAAVLLAAACSAPAAVVDGDWQITMIDGAGVPQAKVFVRIEGGAITGGHDGCNAWGIDRSGTQPVIVSSAQGCPGSPIMLAYAPLQSVNQDHIRIESQGGGLVITANDRVFTAQRRAVGQP